MHVSWNLRNTELPERLQAEAERNADLGRLGLLAAEQQLLAVVHGLERAGQDGHRRSKGRFAKR